MTIKKEVTLIPMRMNPPLTSNKGFLPAAMSPLPALSELVGALIRVSNLGTIVRQDVGRRAGK